MGTSKYSHTEIYLYIARSKHSANDTDQIFPRNYYTGNYSIRNAIVSGGHSLLSMQIKGILFFMYYYPDSNDRMYLNDG